MPAPFGIVSANIRNFPPMMRWKVLAEFERLHGRGALFSFEEIWSRKYRRLQKIGLPRRAYAHHTVSKYGTTLALNRRRFKIVQAARSIAGHGTVPFASGPRQITFWIVESREGYGTIAHASAHPVPGAFKRGKVNRRARRDAWDLYMDRLVAWAERMHKRGHAVAIGMDANAPRHEVERKFARLKGVQIHSNGIDHIVLIDAPDRRWEVEGFDVWPRLHSDHAPIRVRARLVRKR